MRLCQMAGKREDFTAVNEKPIIAAIYKKWLSTQSISYFRFILYVAKQNFQIRIAQFNEQERAMLLMLHYDIWQKAALHDSLENSIHEIGQHPALVKEIIDLLEILIDRVDFCESDMILPFEQPIKLHARYTRDQILTAFGFNCFEKQSSNREGVALNKALNVELLFIDLIKNEKDFSPTTLYNDYAISDSLFHWQSQNQTRSDRGKGLEYIHHRTLGRRILLFVREQAKDEFNNTIGYVFVGDGTLVEYSGSKPMNITWQLSVPLPPYLWKASAKMAVG